MKGNVFIKRPVMAISISVLILAIGLISLFTLPVEQYPDIAPPTVYVTASYTGADAEAVMNSVIMPLEESINGVEDMMYVSSSASNAGLAIIQVYFKQGTDPDMAAVNVQNRVAKAQGLLPAEVTKVGVSTMKRQTSFLQIGALVCTDGRYDQTFLANYLDINVIPQIKRIEGVGDVMELGDTYSMRIWLKPERMAQYGLVPSDITAILGEQNIEAPTGSLGESSKNVFQFTMKYRGRLKSVEEFRNTVVRSREDGSILRLQDVAEVELGTMTYSFRSEMDSQPAVLYMIFQTAGSNATAVNKEITTQIERMEKNLPEGTEFVTMMSSNDFLFASIHNVVETLIIAIILVILVVYFFLQDLKSTLIPSISIIVSLVGTFACLVAAGFSLNILTLFALVLAIGTVVDDAIVVVEAVQSKFDAGYKSAYLATKDAMGDVTMAIVSCTCVFMAVFIPVTFMGGTSGVFYTQFGITMATAVGISMISALTLCPALCAIMMRPSDGTKSAKSINGRVRAAYNASFNAVLGKYKRGVMFFIRHRWMVWTSLAVAVALLVYLMSTTKTGLVPQEDQGVIMVNVSISPGSTLEETTKVMDRLENILKDTPEIEHYARVAGYGLISGQGTSYGTIIIRLKDWSERKGKEHSSDAVVSRLNGQFQAIKEAQVFSFQPAMIPGYGMGNSLELNLQDMTGGELATFYEAAIQFLGALNERPEVAMAYTSYAINFPQISVEVDAAKCKRAGISPSAVLDAVGSYCGGAYISNYNQYGKVYRVMMQASPEYRLDEQALNNMFVRNGTQMAPVSQFMTLKQVLGPETANRFNLYSTITANVNPADGYSSGEVQKVIEEVAAQSLPAGYGYEYGGMAREEASSGGAQTVFIYAICIFLIYLILACLYESFLIPFAVIFSVPFGLMGSFLFAKILGLENNIYLQTGVIMLIGLLAKTAILITEYAIERRRKGMGIVESAYSAAQVRLRPILMTVLTMIFGMLPLMFSSGAGANGNSSLGTGVVGGMAVGTLALLFVVPVFYIIFEFLQEKIRKPMEEEPDVQVLLEKEKSEVERERK
ncbi:efflux RND transporter permease subunit [Bacteroides xylanisolvens]|uniref:efflux RND transporter permease subunit n=1 Tax=Bacteroides xylanisolvens TaxID=371601 RepID=UPI00044F2537|nr:efflux RND transporter permease subunit [Bacteroides xylanisolvens]EXY32108.1 RND transporter, hydrophobe/amphiphile efflux-1 family protein [Bacteroides fragilis str. 3397 T10]MBT9861908.1 efflux RND transporter permease subunit [Bacteroides xylanisolvens]CUO47944.1 The (Largely Gram-negative Bacterial) Hydrophobe/Amphiphile Efflux-1 (HAE1) Family [Bacteroides xylanisolvens]